MINRYRVMEIPVSALEKHLNAVVDDGGQIVQILDGSASRKDYCHVIWLENREPPAVKKGK